MYQYININKTNNIPNIYNVCIKVIQRIFYSVVFKQDAK